MSEPTENTEPQYRVALSPTHWQMSFFRSPDVPGVDVTANGVMVDETDAGLLRAAAERSGLQLIVTEPGSGKPEVAPSAPAPFSPAQVVSTDQPEGSQ